MIVSPILDKCESREDEKNDEKSEFRFPKSVEISDISEEILAALKSKKEKMGLQENVMILDYITSFRASTRLPFEYSGFDVPAVIVCGEDTGRIYLFSIYALIPELHDDNYIPKKKPNLRIVK